MKRLEILELLSDCLSGRDEKVLVGKLSNLSPPDWERLVQTADFYKVAPLLKYRLEPFGPDAAIPRDVLIELQKLFLKGVARNMNLFHCVAEILTAMRRDRIPVIALKGVHLAQAVYPSIGLRQMADVDLLVHKSDLEKAADSLKKAGYSPARDFNIEVETALTLHLPPFKKPGAPLIEIHWTIEKPIYPFRIDIDGLWKRARPATIAGVEIMALSPEDLLLHTCLHASYHHRFDGLSLKAFCDIREIARRHGDEFDWERFTLLANRWRAVKSIHLSLYLAREIVGAPVPRDLLDAMEPDDFDQGIVATATGKIFAGRGLETPKTSRKIALLFGFGSIRSRVAYLLKNLFPSPMVVSRRYAADPDSWRIYLYYPIRCKDLFMEGAKTAWRILRGNDASTKWTERENALEDYLTSD